MKTSMIVGTFGLICLFIVWFSTPVHKIPINQQHEEPNAVFIPSGTVFFNKADVSLVPGADWQQLSSGPFTIAQSQSICFPVLEGEGQNKGSLIQVFATSANSDPKMAADILTREVDSDPNTIKGTFKQDDFISNYRIPVVRVSYNYTVKGILHDDKLRAFVYLFQNKNHNCIAIHYIIFADKASERVDQMINDTLKWN